LEVTALSVQSRRAMKLSIGERGHRGSRMEVVEEIGGHNVSDLAQGTDFRDLSEVEGDGTVQQ
jgi:hypothetical protein